MKITLEEGAFYQTKNFTVGTWKHPEVSREDGGHIVICPKRPVENRWDLDPIRAKELMRLTMIVGCAMKRAMNKRGVEIERLNIHDDGNWAVGTKEGPKLHIHLYGRARREKHQKRGESLYFPDKKSKFWMDLEPLTLEDVKEIVKEIKQISSLKKYEMKKWGLE